MTDPLLVGAQRARPCGCERPLRMLDEDLGIVCGRCGRATGEPVPEPPPARAPRGLRAIARDLSDPPAARPARSTEPVFLTDRALAIAEELGELTATDLAARLDMPRQAASGLLAHLASQGRLVRAGTRASTRGPRPLTLFRAPDPQAPSSQEAA